MKHTGSLKKGLPTSVNISGLDSQKLHKYQHSELVYLWNCWKDAQWVLATQSFSESKTDGYDILLIYGNDRDVQPTATGKANTTSLRWKYFFGIAPKLKDAFKV